METGSLKSLQDLFMILLGSFGKASFHCILILSLFTSLNTRNWNLQVASLTHYPGHLMLNCMPVVYVTHKIQ